MQFEVTNQRNSLTIETKLRDAAKELAGGRFDARVSGHPRPMFFEVHLVYGAADGLDAVVAEVEVGYLFDQEWSSKEPDVVTNCSSSSADKKRAYDE